jgi:hypothetical protein
MEREQDKENVMQKKEGAILYSDLALSGKQSRQVI